MGWFDSIKNGLGSAVNWLSENSGTIANVAKTVANVAGSIIMTEEEKELMNSIPKDDVADLQLNYNKANEYPLETAKSKTPLTQLETYLGSTYSWHLSDAISNPVRNGNPLVTIVQDITKFLHEQDMPTTLKGSGGHVLDIARAISASVFADILSETSGDEDNIVKHPTFDIVSDDKSVAISGCMAYYQIPLGQAEIHSEDLTALHSALYIKVTTTHAFRVTQAMERRKWCFSRVTSQVTGSSGWLVTFRIRWTSAQVANQGSPEIPKHIDSSKFEIIYDQLQGHLQIMKIQATQSSNPYQVKGALTIAIAAALKSLSTPAMYMSYDPISTIAAQLPRIEITNTTLITGVSSARDDWTEVGAHVNGDLKPMDMPGRISKRVANRGDWH